LIWNLVGRLFRQGLVDQLQNLASDIDPVFGFSRRLFENPSLNEFVDVVLGGGKSQLKRLGGTGDSVN
jgi:hypothetical protein